MRRVKTEADEELERARSEAFGTWLRVALERRGWSARKLADTIGCSPSGIALYLRGGEDKQQERFRRPRESMIDAIAEALEIDADEGRRAAGYQPRGQAVLLPERLARLSPSAMQALLQFLDAIEAAPTGGSTLSGSSTKGR